MPVSDLRGILQYIPRFRDRVFVIAFDGEILESENFPNLLLDVAVLRSLNIRVLLVHGVRHQLDRARAEGAAVSNDDGAGVTDQRTLRIAVDAASRLSHHLLEGLSSVDLRAAVVNAVTAHPLGIVGGVDHQFTGRVERIDAEMLSLLLERGVVPVLPSIGFDGEGHTYRVNSDAIAVETAIALKAAKVIFLCEAGSLRIDGEIVRQLSLRDAEAAAQKPPSSLARNLALKLGWAARAGHGGVPRAHLLDGHQNEALLTEVFSREGVGTMVYGNEYEQIRRAQKRDVKRILDLIQQSVRDEALVPRTRADILAHLDDYWVLEVDRTVVGCVAIHPFPTENMAELACLYVSRSSENGGHGRKLVAWVDQIARERGVARLFALSTQAFAYLQQKGGYAEAPPEVLPPARREKYEASGRKSKVLVKEVTPAAVASPAG